jgi:hypothetical protein
VPDRQRLTRSRILKATTATTESRLKVRLQRRCRSRPRGSFSESYSAAGQPPPNYKGTDGGTAANVLPTPRGEETVRGGPSSSYYSRRSVAPPILPRERTPACCTVSLHLQHILQAKVERTRAPRHICKRV